MDEIAGVRFDIFTREWDTERREFRPSALKASTGADGQLRLHGIASSTVKDLHGDVMLTSALEDMERAANNGLTIFGNHDYDVPESIFGWVENAQMKQAGTVDAAGDPIYDLMFDVVMNDDNPRAVATHKAITKGSKLGMSIGAMIPEGGATSDKKGKLTIAHVDLLETSIVGIPANPRSWVENAVKSFFAPKAVTKATSTTSLGQPTLTLDTDAGTYRVEGKLDGMNLTLDANEDVEFTIYECPTCGWKQAQAFDAKPCPNCNPEPGSVALDTLEAATCPDCGRGKSDGGGCQNSFHSKAAEPDLGEEGKAVEPDLSEAKITVIEVDTGDNSGDSSSSQPGPALEDETADGDDAVLGDTVTESVDSIVADATTTMASLEPEVTTAFQRLLDLVNDLTRELVDAKTKEREAIARSAEAKRERDEVVLTAGQLMARTSAILNKLADLPVGRRAVFHAVETDFTSLEGIYSREFMEMLRSKNPDDSLTGAS